MARVLYNTLLPDIQIYAGKCPTPIILNQLRQVARDFYRISQGYVYTLDATDVEAGQTEIFPSLPDQTELLVPLNLTCEGTSAPLVTTTVAQANAMYGNWRTSTGTPGFVMRTTSESLSLVPLPSNSISEGLMGTVALVPTRAATGVEKEILERDGDYLVHGTLARLLAMTGTEWFAPNNVGFHEGRYQVGIVLAKEAAMQTDTPQYITTGYGGL